jgi:GDP-L-fucose synthase
MSLRGKRVWVAGHRGMVGSAIMRRLESEDCDLLVADRKNVDLTDQIAVRQWVARARPDVIILAAAKVGGILANSQQPVDFLLDNLSIEVNVFDAAHRSEVPRLLFLGSSCIYPKFADQPIVESSLLTGSLEPTNEWYALAKIAGIKLTQAFRQQYGYNYISAMPTNLYGPGDNYDLQNSHVLPALIRKVHEAKIANVNEVTIWGSGTPRREFLHVDDCADACLHLLNSYSGSEHVNIGSGEDLTILELAQLVCNIIGYRGEIVCDSSKPDGTPRKLMSIEKISGLGWTPKISLRDGVEATYRWYLENYV